MTRSISRSERKIRYAVIGQGYISQAAMLPAFAHAKENSQLVALFSSDPEKRTELGAKYEIPHVAPYDEFDNLLRQGIADAVYIALPNSMHREYTERAARAGVHVLCEKPMAVTEADCEAMLRATHEAGVKLMIAYRLHFEEANLKAIELARSGVIGELRFFSSDFSQQVKPGDIRLQRELGGGPLNDIGIYCINAARYLMEAEPVQVWATAATVDAARFSEVDEMVSATLRFPGNRLATFTCSFGAASVSSYRLIGTRGDVRLDPAYEIAEDLILFETTDEKTKEHKFRRRDQFAPELLYFSQCILENQQPEPSGWEGLADVRIICALLRSVKTGQPIELPPFAKTRRPDLSQELKRPPVKMPELVNAAPPSGK